jgi:uncharacterized membrane protein (UPF0127 family)
MTAVRKPSFALLLAHLVLGCQSESPTPTPTPIKPPTPTASDTNPDRINQLKDLKSVEIPAPKGTMKLWIMDNPSKRQEGMMFLVDREVKDDEGMIFVFPEVQPDDGKHGFWMHNTPMGLDIAYVSKDNKIVSIVQGQPFNDTMLDPKGEYQYVIELKLGLAERTGLRVGQQVKIPATLRTDQ